MPRRKNEDHVFSLESDFREPLAMLEKMGANKQKMMKSILKGVGTASKAPVRKAYRSEGLNKRTGVLYKSITRKVFRNGKAVIVAAYARNQKNI
ncbi:MAG: hypothetical protein HUK24_06130, partial [Sphaerochaetaceae bacterium]|nr:hypothetical protein [Sphaerochaetaceae bacterium]